MVAHAVRCGVRIGRDLSPFYGRGWAISLNGRPFAWRKRAGDAVVQAIQAMVCVESVQPVLRVAGCIGLLCLTTGCRIERIANATAMVIGYLSMACFAVMAVGVLLAFGSAWYEQRQQAARVPTRPGEPEGLPRLNAA